MNILTYLKKTVLIAGLFSALLLGGCIVVPAHRYAVREDVAIGPPVVGFVWYDGYWDHDHYGRHWVGGHWGPHR